MTNDKPTLPPTDGSLTKPEWQQQLAAAGIRPQVVWEGSYGTKVHGPCYRPATDDDGVVVRVRSYYRIVHPAAPGSRKRKFPERSTKKLAERDAKRIDARLGSGYSPVEAPRRFEPMDVLLDEFLDPANHLDSWKSPRTRESAAAFLNTWVRPVIGHLPCIEWDAEASEHILAQMEKCQLKMSYRAQGYSYLAILANFGRVRRRGFLPTEANPLEDVHAPNASERRFVDRATLPSPDQVRALGENMGEVAAAKWLRRVKNPSAERLARVELERFRWSMLPRIIFGGGLRVNEALALRTGDFRLAQRSEGLGIHIERQAARGSSTRLRPPKHGSVRTTYASDELWDDVFRLVTLLEAEFGPNVLVWPRMYDHTKMLDDSTLFSTYFDPAAEKTAGFTFEIVPQWTVEIEKVEDASGNTKRVLTSVPLLDEKTGKQKTRKSWNWNWRHLRHLFGTLALAPSQTGGWGQDIGDVAVWMGHRSAETTWEYYIGQRGGEGARMASATAVTAPVPPPATPPAGPHRSGVRRRHLRAVS
jgi:integrase